MIPICCLCNWPADKPVIFTRRVIHNHGRHIHEHDWACESCAYYVQTAESELALWAEWFLVKYPDTPAGVKGKD